MAKQVRLIHNNFHQLAPQRYHYRTLAFNLSHSHVVLRSVPGASEAKPDQHHFSSSSPARKK